MQTATTSPRTVIYARVSTTGHGQDVGLQLDELRAVARQRGWNVVAEHVDDGVSGAATSRPALDRLMEAARRGQLDLVAVWRLDRLGRSLQHLLQVLDELQHLGVGFVSVRDAGLDSTSASGRIRCQAPRPGTLASHGLPGRCRTFSPVERRSRAVTNVAAAVRGVGGGGGPLDPRPELASPRSSMPATAASDAAGYGALRGPAPDSRPTWGISAAGDVTVLPITDHRNSVVGAAWSVIWTWS
jgi:hypothetical protein